jgi:hypothetical protein
VSVTVDAAETDALTPGELPFATIWGRAIGKNFDVRYRYRTSSISFGEREDRNQPIIVTTAPNLSKWGPDDANQPFSWPGRAVQRDQTFPQNPSDQLIYEIRVPENALLQEVRTWIDPADGHTDIPESRAQTMIWTHNATTEESNLIASSVASSVSISDYEEPNCLVMEFPSSMKMESTRRVFVYIFGEWGSGALPGLVVDTPDVVFDETD